MECQIYNKNIQRHKLQDLSSKKKIKCAIGILLFSLPCIIYQLNKPILKIETFITI